MKKDVYEACLSYYRRESLTTWDELARRYEFKSGNVLRKRFYRALKRAKAGKPQIEEQQKNTDANSPRVVCFDIETTPMVVYTFDLFNNYISPDSVMIDKTLLSWSAKELNDPEVVHDIITQDEAWTSEDNRIVVSLWNYLNEADILIGHNIREFDIKFMNTRFIAHGLPPIMNFQTIDTLVEARKHFRFSSNKLSFINRQLGIKQKLSNDGLQLWIDCMNGDKKALLKMDEYCQGDVLAVEELYYRLRPFITGHPNIGLHIDHENPVCPNCGSEALLSKGFYYTNTGMYSSYRCDSCGAISRSRSNLLTKEEKQKLVRN